MRKLPLLLAGAFVCAAPLACDFEKTGNQLTAEKVIIGTVLATPPIELSPLGLAGLDAGFDLDGGIVLPPDAGFSSDGGNLVLPAQTAAFVFFGQLNRRSLDTPPEPVTGATVKVGAEGKTAVTVPEKGSGNYQTDSTSDEALQYEAGTTWRFTVTHEGADFVGSVEDTPQLERIASFHPAKGYVEHTAGTAFTFNRPPPAAGKERNIGFVTVFPVSDDGQQDEPTYTNIPDDPLEFLELVALPAKWKADVVSIPGTAFPQPGTTYVVTLQAVKLGGPESDNVFTGSALLVGTAEVGLFRTK